jgi:hypothetical protein
MLIAVRLWILLSALLVASGWILSALHQLNRVGYGVVLALAVVVGAGWWKRTGERPKMAAGRFIHRLTKRFKRPAPFLFLAILILSFMGGALYEPFNGDSKAYRVPRVLHWLGAQQWHWIPTLDQRMNFLGCGFEWLFSPLILFGRDDRLVFLINILSYALLPGLIFSVFTRLKVSARVAWWWMWLLPSGWCFVLQAGSVANDSFAAVYALASVDLALRAKEKGSIADLWLSLLAAALLTGAKQCDIPLAMLWVIAAWPAFALAKRHAAGSAVVVVFGLLVSALPITILNLQHMGSWIQPMTTRGTNSLSWGIIGNAFCIPVQNLVPPYDPWADKWNALMDRFAATPFGHHFASFEHFGQVSFLSHSIGEGNAGIGLGMCVWMPVSMVAGWMLSKKFFFRPPVETLQRRLLRGMPWLLLLLFMAKDCAYENARHLAPYYVFFFPCLLAGSGQTWLVRRHWWQRFGLLLMLCSASLIVISRTSPLFPAQAVLRWLHARHPSSRLISRLEFSYGASSVARAMEREILKDLPPDEELIGYATADGGAEPELWFPFRQRRVHRVVSDDTPETLRAGGIRYIVVDTSMLNYSGESIEQWMEKYECQIVDEASCELQPELPRYYLYLLKLRPGNPDAGPINPRKSAENSRFKSRL